MIWMTIRHLIVTTTAAAAAVAAAATTTEKNNPSGKEENYRHGKTTLFRRLKGQIRRKELEQDIHSKTEENQWPGKCDRRCPTLGAEKD